MKPSRRRHERKPTDQRPRSNFGPQLDTSGEEYDEADDPEMEYRQWRSLQKAPWLPDGLYDRFESTLVQLQLYSFIIVNIDCWDTQCHTAVPIGTY